MIRALCCCLTIGLLGCGEPGAATAPVPARYRFLENGYISGDPATVEAGLPFVKLELTDFSAWTWDETAITLWRDGRAEGPGGLGKVSLYEFGELCFLLERLGFERLEASYDAPADPHHFVTVRAWRDLDRDPIEVVEVSDEGPSELWAIQRAIEGVASRIDWKPDPRTARVTAELIANGFEDAEQVRGFVEGLQGAAVAGNREMLAGMVRYPLTLYDEGRPGRTLASAAEVLAEFDSVFSADVLAALEHASFEQLFVRDQGAMIGDGEVWLFQYEDGVLVKALNPR